MRYYVIAILVSAIGLFTTAYYYAIFGPVIAVSAYLFFSYIIVYSAVVFFRYLYCISPLNAMEAAGPAALVYPEHYDFYIRHLPFVLDYKVDFHPVHRVIIVSVEYDQLFIRLYGKEETLLWLYNQLYQRKLASDKVSIIELPVKSKS